VTSAGDVPGLTAALASKVDVASLRTVNGQSLIGSGGGIVTPTTFPLASITDLAAAGGALLRAADPAAQRTALGLGTAATSAAAAFTPAAHGSATNNPHAVTKAQVGLATVDDTSDAAKALAANPVGAAIAAKYTKPSSGVPATDLTAGVQASLARADAAAPAVAVPPKGAVVVGGTTVPAGADGFALVADSSQAAGVRYGAVLTPGTWAARGDLVAATGPGAPARLAAGADGQCLVADSSAATGLAYAGVLRSSVVQSRGDIIAGVAAGTVARVPVGADGYGLVADSTSTVGVSWRATLAPTSFQAAGDLLVAAGPGTAGRLPIGSAGQVATVSATGGVSWATSASATPMSGSTATTAGSPGLVPRSNAGDHNKLLCGRGVWRTGGYVAMDSWATVRALGDAGGMTEGDRALLTDFGLQSSAELVWSGTDWRFSGGDCIAGTVPAPVTPASVFETVVLQAAVPGGLARPGSAFAIDLAGLQSNGASASTTTYRVRRGATVSDVTGPVLAQCTVANGGSARAGWNCVVHGSVTLTGAAEARGVLWQALDPSNGAPLPAAAAASAAVDSDWHVVVTCTNSAPSTTRTFWEGSVRMRR